jgi:pseudouridine synthase
VNKCFKDFTSRRESDKLVDQGRVTVNGAVVSAGARVFPGDIVRLDGDEVDWETKNRDDASLDAFRYVKYWKPRGITCTTDHRDRTNILDAVRYPERVFPVGRLDKDSTGLILLTSDGRLPNAALRAGAKKEKKYVVCLDRPAREADLQTLREGVVISTPVRRDKVDRIVTARTLPCDVAFVKERNGKENFAAVRVTLREGRNRQIRRMFDAVGYVVRDLHRTEIMGIGLEGLTAGEWKECSPEEMELIRACLEDADADADATEEEEDED